MKNNNTKQKELSTPQIGSTEYDVEEWIIEKAQDYARGIGGERVSEKEIMFEYKGGLVFFDLTMDYYHDGHYPSWTIEVLDKVAYKTEEEHDVHPLRVDIDFINEKLQSFADYTLDELIYE